jgi:sec-independent protein translocase protein TatB
VTPQLIDINGPEFMLLLVLAVILFGPERLPDLARKAARVVRYVRTMAGSAQEQLSKELGPGFEDLDFRDLNPKAFVQKHLLSDVEPIIADVKSEITDVGSTVKGSQSDVAAAINGAKDITPGGPHDVMAAETPAARVLTPFDVEAT